MLFKPMLAAKPDPEELDAVLAKLTYPVLASPKYDGIRVTVQNGKLYSRALKLIPNLELQALWGKPELNGLDGEVIVGAPTAEDCFNRSTSIVMSRDKAACEAKFYVFDSYCEVEPFSIRAYNAAMMADQKPHYNLQGNISKAEREIVVVQHTLLKSLKQLLAYEAKETKAGHEGVMLRSPTGAYKQGRSTLKEGGLIAVKRFVDAEAVILDTYEQEENTNAKTVNELGKSKRSSHKSGKVGKGTLGGFVVQAIQFDSQYGKDGFTRQGVEFNLATGVGLTDAVRAELWAKRSALKGKIVKFRYQKVGTKTAPRIPIFLGFRDGKDL